MRLTGTAAPVQLGPGELLAERGRVLAGTGSTPVELGDVQADGKRRMTAGDWVRGLHPEGRPITLG